MGHRNNSWANCWVGLIATLAIATTSAVYAADTPAPAQAPAEAAPAAAPDPDLESSDPAVAAAARTKAAAAQLAARKITEITGKPPGEVAKAHPIASMRNPFTDDPQKIEEGKKLYFSYSCNGCHGGGGGGGMCPPLTNDIWVYGSDDDILFRLITQGSQEMMKEHSLKRKGSENVVGPMPAFAELIKSDEEVWKIITFIRSLYKGTRRNW